MIHPHIISEAGYASYHRGHLVFLGDDNVWRYEDGVPVDDDLDRPCPRCGRPPTPDGYDACTGYVAGATSVCCGHGVHESIYVIEEVNKDGQE